MRVIRDKVNIGMDRSRDVPWLQIILRGKDPQAGLVVCRICGICGGSHLYKSWPAPWTPHSIPTLMPPNATAQSPPTYHAERPETLRSIPRYFCAVHHRPHQQNYAKSSCTPSRCRFARTSGPAISPAWCSPPNPLEVYAIFGGHYCLQLHGAGRRGMRADLVRRHRSIAILELEGPLKLSGTGCSVVIGWKETRPQEKTSWSGRRDEEQHNSVVLIGSVWMSAGTSTAGVGNYIATGTCFDPPCMRIPPSKGAMPR